MNLRNVNEQTDVDKVAVDPNEALAKVRRARLVLRIIMLAGIILPFVLFFLIHGWPFH